MDRSYLLGEENASDIGGSLRRDIVQLPSKTQFIWLGSRKIDLPNMEHGFIGISFLLLCVISVWPLTGNFWRNMPSCRTCFYRLLQIRTTRRSLIIEAATILMQICMHSYAQELIKATLSMQRRFPVLTSCGPSDWSWRYRPKFLAYIQLRAGGIALVADAKTHWV